MGVDDVLHQPHVAACFDQLVATLPTQKYPELAHIHSAHTELRGTYASLAEKTSAEPRLPVVTQSVAAPGWVPTKKGSTEIDSLKRDESPVAESDGSVEDILQDTAYLGESPVNASGDGRGFMSRAATLTGITADVDNENFIDPTELTALRLSDIRAEIILCKTLGDLYRKVDLDVNQPDLSLSTSSSNQEMTATCFKHLAVCIDAADPGSLLRGSYQSHLRALKGARGGGRKINGNKDEKNRGKLMSGALTSEASSQHCRSSSKSLAEKDMSFKSRIARVQSKLNRESLLTGVATSGSSDVLVTRSPPPVKSSRSKKSPTAATSPTSVKKIKKPLDGPSLKEEIARRRIEARAEAATRGNPCDDDSPPFIPVLNARQLQERHDHVQSMTPTGNPLVDTSQSLTGTPTPVNIMPHDSTLVGSTTPSGHSVRGRQTEPKPLQIVRPQAQRGTGTSSSGAPSVEPPVVISDDESFTRPRTVKTQPSRIHRNTVAACVTAINVDEDEDVCQDIRAPTISDMVDLVDPTGLVDPTKSGVRVRATLSNPQSRPQPSTHSVVRAAESPDYPARQANSSGSETAQVPQRRNPQPQSNGVCSGLKQQGTTTQTTAVSPSTTTPNSSGRHSGATEALEVSLRGEDSPSRYLNQKDKLAALKSQYEQFSAQRLTAQRNKCIQMIGDKEMFEWIYRLLDESRKSSPDALRQQMMFCKEDLQLGEATMSEVLSLIEYESG
eukprot:GHVN01023335.1.p1 GENE.GHVN01023335.1~~GHVN01023335.1.p1  ORF type:complete len:728 (-),score=92.87 GHVN01023335.1:188-2371(-)